MGVGVGSRTSNHVLHAEVTYATFCSQLMSQNDPTQPKGGQEVTLPCLGGREPEMFLNIAKDCRIY